jgi:glycosyltransferase involved in cell wall biosynthesis
MNRSNRTAIFIPAFDAAETIAEALRSVAESEQSVASTIPVYLFDNSSRDNTIEIARQTRKAPAPLHVVNQSTNVGHVINLNLGLQALTRDYDWVLILNADDVVKSNWLSLLLPRMEQCGERVATICTSYDDWYPSTGSIIPGEEDPDRPIEEIPGGKESVLGTLRRGCWWHISGCAIRMKAFESVGDFRNDLPQHHDWDWLLRCLASGWSVEYIARSTLLYRQHGCSVSSNSLRSGLDLKDKIAVYSDFHQRGYLSTQALRKAERGLLYQMTRRTVVRAVRGDVQSASRLARLFATTLVGHLSVRPSPSPRI